jgi:two-component system phosphate regulon sensor histidine kinase PhoR
MILIVDDKPENIYSLKRILLSKNFAVDTALSGEEALKKVLKNDYALIILDVQMPGMDGFEVAEILGGFKKSEDIPIIFLSAVNTEKKFITKGYDSGAIDYVTKPLDTDILLLKVKTFYRLYEQKTELNKIQIILRAEIEARKKVQLELKERVKQLYTTLESLPQLAFTLDPKGKIEFVNKQWYKYSDTSTKFPKRHSDGKNIEEEWEKCRIAGSQLEMEVRIKELNSKDYRFHLLRIIPVKEQEEIIRWVGTFTDIEDQKQIEKKKDEFLSIASHELKTPLTSIKAYIQLLERSLKDNKNKTVFNYLNKTQLQLSKLNTLIADLLDISKIENGKLKLNRQFFNFENMMENVCDIIKQTNENTEIKREGKKIDIPIYADEIRIEQVIINYFTNAIKYSPHNKEIIITTEIIDQNKLKISVKDYGIGISTEKQQKLFDKFYRAEESSLRFQGLGIGLYICSEIIRQHHGECGVNSILGEGSTFYFIIPINNLIN